MEVKTTRVFVYPSDLKFWLDRKSDKSVYRLYHTIQEAFQLQKERYLTIFHLRDYYRISLEDVCSRLY